jgi:hypothetical protein
VPTPDEAEIIRSYLGVAKKREMSEAALARLAGMGRRFVARRDGVGSEDKLEKSCSEDRPRSLAVEEP